MKTISNSDYERIARLVPVLVDELYGKRTSMSLRAQNALRLLAQVAKRMKP